jgi:serine/threonine-protein kinase HipA
MCYINAHMDSTVHLQTHHHGRWHDVAAVRVPAGSARLGFSAPAEVAYAVAYVLDHEDRRDATALSARLPVAFHTSRSSSWPAFLVDLLPQGYGRQVLLEQNGLAPHTGESGDWTLLSKSASNPIGNLRIRQAVHELTSSRDAPGFRLEEVAGSNGPFLAHLTARRVHMAGSLGLQGEWPKILLTEAKDGLLYLDHTLPDDQAVRHWMVKFSHGSNQTLGRILRLEMHYMDLAAMLGLRVHAPLGGTDGVLLIPRFDREVSQGRVIRHAQEGLASLCGLAGFCLTPSHNEACRQLAIHCSDSEREVAEYLRRDIANIALGNKDNHARNTAIQRREDGFIGLTPVFDFAPMMLHPDGIARQMRWVEGDRGHLQWRDVLRQVVEATGLTLDPLRDAIGAMADPLRRLRHQALELGVDEDVMDMQQREIDDLVSQLEAL